MGECKCEGCWREGLAFQNIMPGRRVTTLALPSLEAALPFTTITFSTQKMEGTPPTAPSPWLSTLSPFLPPIPARPLT